MMELNIVIAVCASLWLWTVFGRPLLCWLEAYSVVVYLDDRPEWAFWLLSAIWPLLYLLSLVWPGAFDE